MELLITFLILGLTIILFIIGHLRSDLIAILSLLALVVFGIVEIDEALAGFSNSTVIMLAGLFVIGGGILRTGIAAKTGKLLLKYAHNNETRLLLLLMGVVAIVGSFISTTGTVAIMLPIVIGLSSSIKINPSKYLIPLAYTASISGLMTLIATPTNLIVSQQLEDNGFEKLGFFSLTPIGIVGFITGAIYLLFVRNFLLPKGHKKQLVPGNQLSPNELIHQYHLEERLHRLQVPEDSIIVGKTLKELSIPSIYHLIILKIERKTNEGFHILSNTVQEMAGPNSIIQGNDILYIQGSSAQVARFAVDYQLSIEPHIDNEKLVSREIGIAEVLLTPNSNFINQTVTESRFREKYNLNIIGVNRKGNYLLKDISEVKLRFGDALLVEGSWEEIEFLSKDNSDTVVIGQPTEYASMATANGKAPIAIGILIFMVIFIIFDVFPTVISVLLAAVLMILTGCLRNMDDAYSRINWATIILIAAMLPFGTALEKTGGLALISETIINSVGHFGPTGVLAGIYFVTTIFSQFISKTATSVLFAPIAINAALELGVSPYPFVMAVAAGAGMQFTTPLSPTNALVMTAGNYKFMDFFKAGLPLVIIMFIVMTIIIPVIYPFN